tara:strand:- start:242 stop:511 length:270 start_codon:yes stop_codon:yes gene_type:complete
MDKGDENIIYWILDKTDYRNNNERLFKKNRSSAFDKRKHRIDDVVFYCNKCEQTWSDVPHWVDTRKFVKYPQKNIPTLGKKRKVCGDCE